MHERVPQNTGNERVPENLELFDFEAVLAPFRKEIVEPPPPDGEISKWKNDMDILERRVGEAIAEFKEYEFKVAEDRKKEFYVAYAELQTIKVHIELALNKYDKELRKFQGKPSLER